MKFCIGGVDCQPYHEILYQNTSFLPIMLMMTKTQKICARDANIACITTTDFLSFFFMSTIINESNNNCFSFFKPWLTKFLSSGCPGFGLYLSCLLYFYFLSWRDDVLQWCHIHNLHSTTYVHNHTNTMWVYFTSETLCLLRISFRMPIYFKLLIFFLYLFLSFLFWWFLLLFVLIRCDMQTRDRTI